MLNLGRTIKKITLKAGKSKCSYKLRYQFNIILIVVNGNSLAYLCFNYKQHTITPIFFYALIYLSKDNPYYINNCFQYSTLPTIIRLFVEPYK